MKVKILKSIYNDSGDCVFSCGDELNVDFENELAIYFNDENGVTDRGLTKNLEGEYYEVIG